MLIHAHIETDSADWDGRYTTSYRLEMNEAEEKDEDFGDYEFYNRVIGWTVMSTGTGSRDEYGFTWHQATEEGYHHREVRWCDVPDCTQDLTMRQRDHRAEAAGY